MVGDGEGVVCIPAHLAEEIAAEAVEATAYEAFVEIQVKAGRPLPGLYPATPESRAEFARWRAARGEG
jgi:regulator of RNase E activity RraA